MPKLVKKFPYLKIVLTGGGYEGKRSFLINVGIVSKEKLLNLIKNSKMMVVPINKGTGTRIKIIEALLVGAKILTTKKGIEGILIKKNKSIIVCDKKYFYKNIINNLNKSIKNKLSKFYFKNYIMEEIVRNFMENKHVKNIFKNN